MRVSTAEQTRPTAEVRLERDTSGAPVLTLAGRLDSETTGDAWRRTLPLADEAGEGTLILDASGVEYCDGAGAGLLLALRQRREERGGRLEIRGLREEFAGLLRMIEPRGAGAAAHGEPVLSRIASLGRDALKVASDLRKLVVFVGELCVMLARAARAPATVRWRDAFLAAERVGVGATPIMALVGFLLGLILSFQSAIPMQRFGAQIFVADLLGIAMLRELGPLMAAILLAARSGSAFAAELGTMKVNEEIDALTTMGLEPVRFLIVPRVIAAVFTMPALIMVVNLAGLVGGAVVFLSLGFPLVTYTNRVIDASSVGDLAGGLFKGMVFGIIVAGVGCLRGLQTGTGAGAVGESTTSSVVSGIVLIAFASAFFAVVFYVLGI